MADPSPAENSARNLPITATTSHAYRALGEAFAYPDDALCRTIRTGTLADDLRDLLHVVDPALAAAGDWHALSDAGTGDALAIEYTRLFDVGASEPPCPLYGGLYCTPRTATLEEMVRFYNHFDLTLADPPRQLPDHLTTQLEFLHVLAYREAEALARSEDPGAYRRAQRDFVARHPGRWVPELRKRLARQQPMAFFIELAHIIERFLGQQSARLVALVGPVPAVSVTHPAQRSLAAAGGDAATMGPTARHAACAGGTTGHQTTAPPRTVEESDE